MARIDVRGAIDMHCHSAPSLFPRIGDAGEISRRAQQAGMRGILFKAHHTSTFDRAYQVNDELRRRAEETGEPATFGAFGSVTLNHHVGGINPQAAGTALRQGCRAVFMPTLDSAFHAQVFGGTGGFGAGSMKAPAGGPIRGISVLDADGNLTDETAAVVDLVAEHHAILGTSHLSPHEQLLLADHAVRRGVTVVVSHAYFLPGIDLDFCRQMAGKGAMVELSATVALPNPAYQVKGMTLRQAVEIIEAVGAPNCIVDTDAGQPFNPWPHEALRMFAQLLHEVGVSEDHLQVMMVANPRRLLGIPAQ